MIKYIVVEQPESWNIFPDNVEIIAAKEYLTLPKYSKIKKARIFNLCHNYTYQSIGYYVSLLAEARGHISIPTVKNLADLRDPSMISMISEEFDELIQRSLKDIKSRTFTLSVYFGQNVARKYERLSGEIYKYFQIPLLRVFFEYSHKWIVKEVKAIPLAEVPDEHYESLQDFTLQYFTRKRFPLVRIPSSAHDLAILVRPDDPAPPSNPKAIKRFVEAAEEMNFRVEWITAENFSELSTFDALFIRMGTDVNNESYLFARKAEQEGIALIDYPSAILRCCNKVYMAEALENSGIERPHTVIIHRENLEQAPGLLGLPMILKTPDSSFSFGVKKAPDEASYFQMAEEMLEQSDLIIGQEFIPSSYDWRIGIIDQQPFFACRYYMAKGHWQIYNWNAPKKKDKDGLVDAVALEEVPDPILKAAVRAARLMGDGLYGIDLKEVNGRAIVIEINDNPSMDFGVEDGYYGKKIYQRVIRAFKERLDRII